MARWKWIVLLNLAVLASSWGVYLVRGHILKNQIDSKKNKQPGICDSIATFTLGRMLFFETELGGDSVSCASCHIPTKAFAGGKFDITTRRKVPSLINVRYQKALFWDGGSTDLESQAVASLGHAEEIGANISTLANKLIVDKKYVPYFKKAFCRDTITLSMILKSIAAYERNLVSFRTFWDGGKLNGSLGETLYKSECWSCHVSPLFTDQQYHVILPSTNRNQSLESDLVAGRYRITRRISDWSAFKTPSLRNLSLTGPYMHDNTYATLTACLNHGIHGDIVTAARFHGLSSKKYVAELISFLDGLTDTVSTTTWENTLH